MEQLKRHCLEHIPRDNWQFVHRIDALFPGGHAGQVVGVTTLFAERRSIRCTIMTIEGLVLFDARYDRRITVKRAVPPFDNAEFARGLIDDIRLIFFPPGGNLIQSGRLQNGSHVCRYRHADGQTVDIIRLTDQSILLQRYTPRNRIDRSLHMVYRTDKNPALPETLPHRLKLEAKGPSAYTLIMELLEATPLEHKPD